MPRYKVMVAQFPGGNSTHPDVADWVTETVLKMRDDPLIGVGNVSLWRINDTPITMGRNRCLIAAERQGCDYVLMVDSDMSPDLPVPGARPFWDAAWAFARDHAGPCCVAAPYCGPPPVESVYVFRWKANQGDNPQPDFQLEAYGRAEAARLTGIGPAAALPTGLMLIDMKGVARLKHPRFYYEWEQDGPSCPCCGQRTPGPQAAKAGTEDVTFSRDLDAAGVPLYCAWDSWAGHHKSKCVGKPQEIPAEAVPRAMWERAKELTGAAPLPTGQPTVPEYVTAGDPPAAEPLFPWLPTVERNGTTPASPSAVG